LLGCFWMAHRQVRDRLQMWMFSEGDKHQKSSESADVTPNHRHWRANLGQMLAVAKLEEKMRKNQWINQWMKSSNASNGRCLCSLLFIEIHWPSLVFQSHSRADISGVQKLFVLAVMPLSLETQINIPGITFRYGHHWSLVLDPVSRFSAGRPVPLSPEWSD
jgi:hypothetical protein